VPSVTRAASAQDAPLDRTVLPIPDTQYKYPGKVPIDARDAKFPQIKELRPPKGSPNIVVILLDDIGFGAPSTFGGSVNMPTMDSLAKQGLRYTQFHTTALCSRRRVMRAHVSLLPNYPTIRRWDRFARFSPRRDSKKKRAYPISAATASHSHSCAVSCDENFLLGLRTAGLNGCWRFEITIVPRQVALETILAIGRQRESVILTRIDHQLRRHAK